MVLQKTRFLKNDWEKQLKLNLVAKNLSKQANSPDFLIAFSVAVEDKVDVRSDRFGYGYGYGYRPGYYRFGYRSRYYGFGYGSGYYGNSGLDVYQYKESTLILDFIDPASTWIDLGVGSTLMRLMTVVS